jgi:hypothetical protein
MRLPLFNQETRGSFSRIKGSGWDLKWSRCTSEKNIFQSNQKKKNPGN